MFRSLFLLTLAGGAVVSLACDSKKMPPHDGGGFTCPDPPEPTDDPNLISDFEDGRAAILQSAGRNGGWYAYNDITDAEYAPDPSCTETPAVDRCATEAPAAAVIEGGRCGSTHAFRFYGLGCKGYAGVGTDLAAPLPPDGGDQSAAICADGGTPPVAHKTPYDLSNYKAISFWGRMGEKAVPIGQKVQFKLPMLVDSKIPDGGDCDPVVIGGKCSASYGAFLDFTQTWTEYTVNLDPHDHVNGIAQESWGKIFDWDPKNVTSIQFQAKGGMTFDIWIDDIRLIPRS
jgi:hypothetical protein